MKRPASWRGRGADEAKMAEGIDKFADKASNQFVFGEYKRGGSLQYLAAWDVHRAKVFGRCEPRPASSPSAASSTRW